MIKLPKKILRRPSTFLYLLFALLATGCITAETTWPGVTAAGDKVFVAYANNIWAVDVAGQNVLWNYAGEEDNAQFFAPPLIVDDKIVIGDYGRQQGLFSTGLTVSIYALNNSDTRPSPQWVTDEGVTGRVFARPLQLGDRIIVPTNDNQVLAFDADSGARLWEFRTANAVWSTPAHNDGVIYVSSLDKNVYAIDVETGEEIWRRSLTGANAASPIFDDGRLYVGSFGGGVHALDAANGEELWFAPAADWVWAAPALVDGVIYYTDLEGNVYAADAETGSAIWSVRVPGTIEARPLVLDDRVYIASGDPSTVDEPQGYLSALSKADGSVVWEKQVEAPIRSSIADTGDSLVVVIVTDVVKLIQFDTESGSQIWTVSPGETSG